MSLAKRLAEFTPPERHRPCVWCQQFKGLSKADREAILGAMADPQVSDRTLATVMEAEGLYATPAAIGRHRRGECSAGKP